jgi:flavin-dependent dehydrogenase
MSESRRKRYDVVVVGSGPAGISTAINLVNAIPTIRDRMIVLDKASHPRKKVCGGGLSQYAMYLLRRLDINMDMPSLKIRRTRIVVDSDEYSEFVVLQGAELCTVMREEFDEALVRSTRSLGIEVIEDEPVTSFSYRDDMVVVHTQKRDLAARVLVGADGTISTIRKTLYRQLRARGTRNLCSAVRFMERVDSSAHFEHRNLEAVMDFSCTFRNGIRGYAWSFPVITRGQAWLNTGVGGFNTSQNKERSLRRTLKEFLSSKGISMDVSRLEGHQIRWFHPSSILSANRVLLVGDAAGIDPLWGEGISFSLGYGQVAASAIAHACENNEFSFLSYKKQLLEHELGKALMNRLQLADRLYRSNSTESARDLLMSVLSLR